MMFDGQGHSDPEFEKHVVDSLGAFATKNLWSMNNLRDKIDHKDLLIEHLKNNLKQTKEIIKERVSSELVRV